MGSIVCVKRALAPPPLSLAAERSPSPLLRNREVLDLLRRQPGVAAEEDQLPPGVGLGEMRFEDRAVLGREMPEYLGNTAVLTRFGQLKRAIDCRCHESRRYHEPRAETNGKVSCRIR